MSKFTTTDKRNGACEICGDISGKCRRIEELHLCMTFADAKKGEVQNGYKCIKADTKRKGWASFKLDNSQEWTAQERQQWKVDAQQRRSQQAAIDAERKARSLDAIERDRAYRKLFAELTLHPDDRADLIRRGLTNEQIERAEFRSVQGYQKLREQYPNLLAGVHPNGRSLVNTQSGYLCPIRNKDGLIVGCQIRLRVLVDGDSNRYRWLSKPDKSKGILHLFPDGGDPAGELPLAVCRPPEKAIGIALVEGTGAKPNITSHLLNLIAIGAAGGQFASSSATLRETLEQLAIELKTRTITVFPDAGDVRNDRVMPRLVGLIALLQQWKFKVKIGWWGQVEKRKGDAARARENCDIDELPLEELAEIGYLSPTQFKAIAAEQGGLGGRGFAPKADHKADRAWQLWRSARQFTPTQTIKQRYFDAPVPDPGTLTAVKSGLGTGKTEWIRRIIEVLNAEGWIALGYRNSLLIQSAQRWGFYHLHNDNAQSLLADPYLKIACCVDSLPHFEPHYFDNKNVILDEACSIISHLHFARTAVSKKRRECKAKFAEALRRAKRIFVLDGLLSDKDIRYLQELIGDPRKVVKIKNEYQGNGKQITMLQGALNGRKLKLNDRSPLIQQIKLSNCCAIATDSQIEAEGLDKLLSEQGKKVVRLDSKTSGEAWVPNFLNDTVNWLQTHRPDVLIFTPSAESGVDIPIVGYFEQFFCLFFGAVLTNAQQQMIGRIRDTTCPTYVACRTAGIPGDKVSRATLPEELMQVMINYVLADGMASLAGTSHETELKALMQRVTELSQTVDFHHECQLLALQNHEEQNLRACLIEALTQAGHQVKEVRMSVADIDDLNDKREQVKDYTAADLFEAETISLEEAEALSSKTGLDWRTRCQIEKARMLDRLPGIEQSPRWSEKFIRRVKFDDRDLIQQCQLFWLFHQPEVAQPLQQSRWFNSLRSQNINIAHHRSHFLKVKAMHEVGLMQFLEPGFTWSKDSPEVHQLFQRAQESEELQTHLGQQVGKLDAVGYVGRLLGKLGLTTQDDWVTTENGRVRVYQLEAAKDADRLAILQALDVRYQEYIEGTIAAIDWATLFAEASPPETQPQAATADHLTRAISINQNSGDQQIDIQSAVSAPVEGVSAIEAALPSPVEDAALSAAECPVSAIEVQLLNTPEAIADIAQMLESATTPEEVKAMRTLAGMTFPTWKAALEKLVREQRQRVNQWMNYLIDSGQLVRSSA